MNFQVNTCPLCYKVCELSKVAGVTFFSCPTKAINFDNNSHYKVRFNSKTEIQHILIYPYSIDSFADTSKSRVYYSSNLEDKYNRWKLIMEVPLIHADNESKLLDRINKLMTFL